MSVGKYSPTVSHSYCVDQDWWDNHEDPNNYGYDLDGYDSYGYNKDGLDRAGFCEEEYLLSYDPYYDEYPLYEDIRSDWHNRII